MRAIRREWRNNVKRLRLLVLLVIAVGALVGTTGCGSSSSSSSTADTSGGNGKSPVKVGFLYAGSHKDGGWSESWDRSRLALQKKYAGQIETTFKENVPDGPQSAPAIESLIRDGATVIVATSYGEGRTIIDAARRHPDVKFLQSQWASPGIANLSGFDNAPEDGAYVAGVAIGQIVPDGAQVGWVDAFPIPYDLRTIDGFALGLNSVNPTATVNVVMTNSWTDANKIGQAARSLASENVGALSGSLSGPATGEVAEKNALPYVSISVDGRKFAPQQTVVSTLYDWLPAVEPGVKSVLDGTWKSQFYYVGMKEGAVNLSSFGGPFDKLTAKQQQAVHDAEQALKSGARSVFQGPIRDSSGKLVVQDGQSLTAAQLEALNFTVPNVKGVQVQSNG
jgi:basic membrane protein A and related proteins